MRSLGSLGGWSCELRFAAFAEHLGAAEQLLWLSLDRLRGLGIWEGPCTLLAVPGMGYLCVF